MTQGLTLANGSNVPAFIQPRENSIVAAGLNEMGQSLPTISLKGSRFSYVKEGAVIYTSDTLSIDVVVVGLAPHNARTYYAKQYDGSSDTLPDCSSWDGVTPDANVATKQSNQCSNCPRNVKQAAADGSGKMVTPCGYNRTMAVMVPGDPNHDVWMLRLSSMTLFNKVDDPSANKLSYRTYMTQLSTNKVNPEAIVTRLSFKAGESVPVLMFTPVAYAGDPSVNYTKEEYEEAVRAIDDGRVDAVLHPRMDASTSSAAVNVMAHPQQVSTPPAPPAADPTTGVTGGATPPPGGVVDNTPPPAQTAPPPQAAPPQSNVSPFPDPSQSTTPPPQPATPPPAPAPSSGSDIAAILAKNNL